MQDQRQTQSVSIEIRHCMFALTYLSVDSSANRKIKSFYMPIPWAINNHEESTSLRSSNPDIKPKPLADKDPNRPWNRTLKKAKPNEVTLQSPSSSPPAMTFEPNTSRTQHDQMHHNYIQWNPPHIGADDFDYLLKKGAFTIPHTGLRNALLKSYIDYVHPHLPMLDLNDFLWRIQKNDGTHCISPLLFQAVMFAGASFVDLQYLHLAGYRDRDSARRGFFHRTRLLFDFDMDMDRISIVQSLILMSYWHDFSEEKDCRHWLEIGLSLAQRLSLHRDPTGSSLTSECSKMRKRLWWSICACDEWISVRSSCQNLISKAEYDVPMLSLDDFDLDSFRPELNSLGLGDSWYLHYPRDIAVNFIQRVASWPRFSHKWPQLKSHSLDGYLVVDNLQWQA